jgi:hypothetical protein
MAEAAVATGAGSAGAGTAGASAGAQGGSGTQAQTGHAGAGNSATSTQAGASSTQGAGANAGTQADWTASLSDDFKGFVQNKGWKDPNSLVESYRNLEKLNGSQDKLLKLPNDDADVQGWDSIYTRLGKPAKPDGYGLKGEKGADPEFAGWASDAFHKANLTEKQAKALIEGWNGRLATQKQAEGEKMASTVKNDEIGLRKDWGMAYEQNLNLARRAARDFGVEKQMDAISQAMGPANAAKFFHRLALSGVEPGFVSGNGQASDAMLTPAMAKSQINALKADPEFTKKYAAGNAEAKAKMQRLHQFAYPDMAS